MNRLRAELRYLATAFGYWIRPYDMLADRRRWRSNKPVPCGRAVLASMTLAERAQLEAAVEKARAERAAPCGHLRHARVVGTEDRVGAMPSGVWEPCEVIQ